MKENEETAAKILIVDDSHVNMNLLSDALEPQGYQIFWAPSGEDALEMVQRNRPDLILLDIVMPAGIDGFETCRKLKKEKSTADIPVIFVTAARDETESVVEGFRVGGVDYISQPVEKAELLVRVQNQLKIDRLTKALQKKNDELQQEIAKRKQAEKEREQAEDARQTADERLSLISKQEAERWGIDAFIGKSRTFARILKNISRLQATGTVSVLITGETGTGKELIARAIHFGGPRAKGPFIAVNCSAIAKELAEAELFGHVEGAFTGAIKSQKGKFECADGGTLFLDEIGEMPLDLQPKFLRVLEDGCVTPVRGTREKHVDVRILAATNTDLRAKIAEGSFRRDLYFRIAEFLVTVPPLRDRKEDIPLLAGHFLNRYATEMGIEKPALTQEALAILESYPFPEGNVRELRNIIIRALIKCDGAEILPKHLDFLQPDEAIDFRSENQTIEALINKVISEANGYSEAVEEFQRCLVEQTLKACDWNRHEAARRLKMDRSNLIKFIKRREIKVPRRDT